MRCHDCKYTLWDLNEPVCPECGRAFVLAEWDFSDADARFACVDCGEALPGETPRSLPATCLACGQHVDAQRARVRPGPSGRDVPRVDANRRFTRAAAWSCSVIMAVSFVALVLLAIDASDHVVGHIRSQSTPNLALVTLSMLGITLGVLGAWPFRLRRRLVLTGSLFAVAIVALTISAVVQDVNRARHARHMQQSRWLRGVAQGMMIHMQNTGTVPATPQSLVDLGYLPPELFSPLRRRHTTAPSTAATALPNGWIRVGDMHIDWTPSAWNWQNSIVVMTLDHRARRDGTLWARSDGSVHWVSWGDLPAKLSQANADRAVLGLPPIPAAALPPP